MDKTQAVKHFKDLGYDADIRDGVLYLYYDGIHDNDTLMEFLTEEVKKIGYRQSFGVRSRGNTKPAAAETSEIESE